MLGKFHAQGSLAGYGAWDPRESDMTERPNITLYFALGIIKRRRLKV